MADAIKCPRCGAELPADAPAGICPKCLMAAGLASDTEAYAAAPSAGEPTAPLHGTSGFNPPEPARLAAHFPQLEVLELLGHGGMGAVYKARQPRLDRLVALKIIRPEAALAPAFAERFNREARMLARLGHPHIVAVYDFGEVSVLNAATGGQPRQLYFFLMEYVDGANLRQLMQTGELTPKQALAIVLQICEALQFAHDEGVVHRDIKPENILLDKRGRVKIADFGLAKLIATSVEEFTLTGTHQVMGTPRYMAPEQMEGSHEVDHRADIYSLGVVFYELLTGEVPMGHFEPPSKKVEIDARLDEVVLRSLAREPERRYQHASDVKTDVESISSVHSAPARPPSEVESVPPTLHAGPTLPAKSDITCGVQNPAWGLIISGVISWVMIPLAFWLPIARDLDAAQSTIIQVSFGVIPLVVGTIMSLAGFRMLRLEGYRLAMFAAVLPIVVLILKLIGISFRSLAINPADLVGAPMGLWALVVLSRDDVKAAFAGKATSHRRGELGTTGASRKSAAASARSSTLGMAWDAWWAERDQWFTTCVLAVLALVSIFCLWLFLGFSQENSFLPANEHGEHLQETTVVFGVHASPYCRMVAGPLGSKIAILGNSWSWAIMMLGLLTWYALWQIKKTKTNATGKKLRWWHGSPNFTITICLVLVAVEISWGILLLNECIEINHKERIEQLEKSSSYTRSNEEE